MPQCMECPVYEVCIGHRVDRVCGEPSWYVPDMQGYLVSSVSRYLGRSGRAYGHRQLLLCALEQVEQTPKLSESWALQAMKHL